MSRHAKLAPLATEVAQGITPLWVWPHEGRFEGDTIVSCSLIDEMELRYELGMTMTQVCCALEDAYLRIYGCVEKDENGDELKDGNGNPVWEAFSLTEAEDVSRRIKGAWIVPHYVWAMVGAAASVDMGSDSIQYSVNEAVQRMVASQAVLHIGESNPAE